MSVRASILCFLLLALCPGCLTERAVRLELGQDESHATSLYALARFPIDGGIEQLAATDNQCRATLVGDGTSHPSCTVLERVAVGPAASIADPEERILAAYSSDGATDARLLLIELPDGRHIFAIRDEEGAWRVHPVTTFTAPARPDRFVRVFNKAAYGTIVGLAVVGDALVFASVVGAIIAYCT